MRILLTGGTGFIGRALSLALARRRDDVVLVSRGAKSGRSGAAIAAAGSMPRVVSWDGDAVERELEHADAVIHLAGEPVAGARWTDARLARIRASRVDTTDRIARAIAQATRRPRVFVSASAVGYYGMRRDDRALDESAPPGDDVLARMCVDWERAAAPAEAVTRVAHPRFGVVLGRDGGALASMTTPFRLFVGGPIGSGTQWLSWVHLRDAVNAVLFAVDHDALTGAFNVTAPEPVDMDTFARALGVALHRPSAFRVPAAALRLAVGRGLAQMLLTGQRAMPVKLVAQGFSFELSALGAALDDVFRQSP